MNGRSNPGLPPWAIFDRPLRGLNVLQNLSLADITIGKLDDWPRPLPSPKGERFTDPLWETLNNAYGIHRKEKNSEANHGRATRAQPFFTGPVDSRITSSGSTMISSAGSSVWWMRFSRLWVAMRPISSSD